jgi:hypothetical protein
MADRRALRGRLARRRSRIAAFAAPPTKGIALLILGLTHSLDCACPQDPDVARPLHGVACGAVCMTRSSSPAFRAPSSTFVQSGLDRRGIVATKAAVQTLKIVYFGAVLVTGGGELSPIVAAMAIVLAIVGTQASRRVLDRISDTQFLQWSRRLIIALSIAYLGQGAWLVA